MTSREPSSGIASLLKAAGLEFSGPAGERYDIDLSTKGLPPLPEKNEKNLLTWEAWLFTRPRSVQRVAERLTPWEEYRLGTTGQICRVLGFDEHKDGTVTVNALCYRAGESLALYGRYVFGLKPEDLEVLQ